MWIMGKRNLFQKGLQVQAFSDNGMFPYFVVLSYVIGKTCTKSTYFLKKKNMLSGQLQALLRL